jgi:propionate catabolism operon transcriptional regulator
VLPPLRERTSDIPMLAAHLLKLARRMSEAKAAHVLLESVLPMLAAYSWPGNVRELQNVIERIAVELEDASDAAVTPSLLRAIAPELTTNAADLTLKQRAQKTQADEIRAALEAFDGDRDKTCAALGISKTTLWRKLNAAR